MSDNGKSAQPHAAVVQVRTTRRLLRGPSPSAAGLACRPSRNRQLGGCARHLSATAFGLLLEAVMKCPRCKTELPPREGERPPGGKPVPHRGERKRPRHATA